MAQVKAAQWDPTIWYRLYTPEGKPYYYNRARKLTQWDRPEDVEDDKLIDFKPVESDEDDDSDKEEDDPNRVLSDKEEQVIQMEKQLELLKQKALAAEKALEKKQVSIQQATLQRKKAERLYTAAVWVKKWTNMTQGKTDGHGEEYYYNTQTGETVWEKPEGYMSPEEIKEAKLKDEVDFDLSKSVEEVLRELGVTTDDFENDVATLFGKSKDTIIGVGQKLSKRQIRDRIQHRMKQFYLAFKNIGSADEWLDVFTRDDFKITKIIYAHWNKKVGKTASDVRGYVCFFVHSVALMYPEVFEHCIDGTWNNCDYAMFAAQCEKGIAEVMKTQFGRDAEIINSWLSLIASVFWVAADKVDTKVVPSSGFIASLLDIMSSESEDIYLVGARCFLAYVDTFIEKVPADFAALRAAEPHEIITSILASPKSHTLVEAITFLFNTQRAPYDDEKLLGQLCHMVTTLLSTTKSATLLSQADTNIMIDIALVEIENLEEKDKFRTSYIRMLHLILKNTPWRQQGRYRRDAIRKGLDSVAGQANVGMDKAACDEAVKVLMDCQEDLV